MTSMLDKCGCEPRPEATESSVPKGWRPRTRVQILGGRHVTLQTYLLAARDTGICTTVHSLGTLWRTCGRCGPIALSLGGVGVRRARHLRTDFPFLLAVLKVV
jgi:hypothetical protein